MSYRLLPRLASATRQCTKARRSQRLAVATEERGDKNPVSAFNPKETLCTSRHHQELALGTSSAYHQGVLKSSSSNHQGASDAYHTNYARPKHTSVLNHHGAKCTSPILTPSAPHQRALHNSSTIHQRALHTSSTLHQRALHTPMHHHQRNLHGSPVRQQRTICNSTAHHSPHSSSPQQQMILHSCSMHQHRALHTSPSHLTHAIQAAEAKEGSVVVWWVGEGGEGGEGEGGGWLYPYPWLRENCPCASCYDTPSLTRILTLEDWDLHDTPLQVKVSEGGGGMEVKWKSGHVSHYEADWLRSHGFTESSRKIKRSMLALKKDLWAHHLDISRHDFTAITTQDEALLDFLVRLEKVGVALVTGAPREPKAAFTIVNKIGFPKQTHYGIHYPIRNKVGANTLAYTDKKLGMHNDLPYFNYVPGIIFLHCIRQFEGDGGENDLADGYHVAQYLRQRHPGQYRTLASTPVYFFNKGKAMVEHETTEFYKLFDTAVIVEDPVRRNVVRLNFSQLRHSYFDVPPEMVTPWYNALRLFHDTMHHQAVRRKLDHGEMLVMDNTRLLHGRTAYNGALGERYMDQVYLDWDVALSKRRVLQENLGVHIE